MPAYTYDDRMMLDTESSLWIAWGILRDCHHGVGAWALDIAKVRDEVKRIASEIRDHNDQFEE